MALLTKRWEPDGRDALAPRTRMVLSIVVTGVVAFVLEYVGTKAWSAYYYTNDATFYIVIAAFAFLLGPALVFMRKWSIAVPMVLVGVLMFVLELFNHYLPMTWTLQDGVFIGTLSGTRVWDWVGGSLFGIEHPLLIALVAGLIETVVVPVSVLLQKLLTMGLRPAASTPLDKLEELFKPSVYPLENVKPKRDFGFLFLRLAGLAFAVYCGYLVVGLVVGARDLPLVSMYFMNPAATINTFGKLIVLSAIAATGAFNVRVRRESLVLLTVGHILAVAVSLWLYLGYPVNPLFPGDHDFLLSSAIVDGVLLVLLIVLIFRYPPHSSGADYVNDIEMQSPASTAMRLTLLISGIAFSAVVVVSVVGRILSRPGTVANAIFGGPDPLIINTVTKFGTYAAVCFMLYAKPRLRRYMTQALILPFGASMIAAFVYTITGPAHFIMQDGSAIDIAWYAPLDLVLVALASSALLGVRRMQYHVDQRITSLRPGSAECAMALHEALREESQDPASSRRDVLGRIDEYIGGIRGRRRGLIGAPFFVLEQVLPRLFFLPQFSALSREEARWLLRRRLLRPFYERIRTAIPPLADALFQVTDTLNSLVSLAYFSSQRGWSDAGYVPPDGRRRLQPQIATERPPNGAALHVLPQDRTDPNGRQPHSNPEAAARLLAPRLGIPSAVPTVPDEVDYCIIGSGAAGGVLAYRLAAARGATDRICVIEQGGHYGARADFNDDEMRMIRTLYTDGGLQVTRSFDFTILQGECVGGTTVINNAVCFQMPEPAQKEWENFGFNFAALGAHYARVASEINISTLTSESVNERVERLFSAGVNAYNASPHGEPFGNPARVMGNFSDCVGCGLCNIGCRRMRKMSTLETYLPWAVAHGATIVPNTAAVQCEMEGSGARRRARAVVIRRPDGSYGRIRVRKAVILAGGAIASSRFLLRTGVGGANAGQGVSCNFALPTLVQFPETEVLDAFDGLQITMYAAPSSYDAIYETTFNPPGAHSIVMPQYFERHKEVIDRYRNSVNFGALVGSDPGGSVSRDRSVLLGRAIDWKQTPRDLEKIKVAMATMARFAKGAGAAQVLLPTHPVLRLPLGGDIEATLAAFHERVNDPAFINFVTAHPQGGNMMADASRADRVVDLDYRVRDCENVYVCDASVFPRGARVNPQWTIMALASQAGDSIAAAG